MYEQGSWDDEAREQNSPANVPEVAYANAVMGAVIVVLVMLIPTMGLLFRFAHWATWYLLAPAQGGDMLAIQVWWLIPCEWLLFVGEVALIVRLSRPLYRRIARYFSSNHAS